MDSCKIGPAVRLFWSWHGSHGVAKLSHEKVAGVGRTKGGKLREMELSKNHIQSFRSLQTGLVLVCV